MQEYELVAICAAILACGRPGANPKHLVGEAVTIIAEALRAAGTTTREQSQSPSEEITSQRKRRAKE